MTVIDASPGIGEAVAGLTTEVFERVQASVDRFASDERRVVSDGSVILKDHVSIIFNPAEQFGFMDVKVSQSDAEAAATNIYMGAATVHQMAHDRTHLPYADLMRRVQDNNAVLGRLPLTLSVLRDRFPQGHTDHHLNDGEIWGGPGYDPTVLGMRHKLGVKSGLWVEDSERNQQWTWTFATQLQTRFDRPEPQRRMTSEITVSALDGSTEAVVRHKQVKTTEVSEEDIVLFRDILDAAKDLRPVVTPIRTHLQRTRYWQQLSQKMDLIPEA